MMWYYLFQVGGGNTRTYGETDDENASLRVVALISFDLIRLGTFLRLSLNSSFADIFAKKMLRSVLLALLVASFSTTMTSAQQCNDTLVIFGETQACCKGRGLDFFDENNGNAYAVMLAFIAGFVGLVTVTILTSQVLREPRGTDHMQFVSDKIHEGAKAFLHKEYTYLSIFVLCLFVVLCFILKGDEDGKEYDGVYTGISFLVGALLSASAGYFGMFIATKANVATTQACTKSMNDGLRVAFKSGSVMGLTVVSFGLFGLASLYIIFTIESEPEQAWRYISGFGFGASAIALFARVGGGVYTKAADVGADLVGKVEAGIPEDHPSNPAVIADNVGDNVGDVAGMGADLFESYCGSIIAAATLGYAEYSGADGNPCYMTSAVALPFWIAGFGVLCSIIGMFLVRTNADEKTMSPNEVLDSLLWTIRKGIFGASLLVVALNAAVVYMTFGDYPDDTSLPWKIYGCTIIGLAAGNIIGTFTEYCTSYSFTPTQSIAQASTTGPATVLIQGLGVGLISTAVPLITLVVSIISCNVLAGQYGIAIAAVSMLSTLGITLATDAYGPVADNAGGIAEMCEEDVSEETRVKTDALDALGNTTAATGKGFAIGSAALTSVALISAFLKDVQDASGGAEFAVKVDEPVVLSGVLIGGTLPFVFAALTMLSVGKAATTIIFEVRRQFKRYPRLKDVTWKPPAGVPEYETCVAISTEAALIEMVVPGAMAVFVPAGIGFLLGPKALAGLLVGALSSGTLLAITMANAGGAWDNAKKYVEKGGLGDGKGKNTSYHEAVVVGDTVGDPFKDTSGPALNILIKMMSLIALVLAPKFQLVADGETFPEDYWIGIVILAILLVALWAFQSWSSKRYERLESEVFADAGADGAAEAGEVELTEKKDTKGAAVAAI